MKAKVFVGYSHHDKKYLNEASLIGYLKGLQHEGIADFWSDERITTGDLWDVEVQAKINESHVALLLVSQWFLNSPYIQNREIPRFLEKRKRDGLIIFPIIVSACEWTEHVWLKETQFLPRDGENIESHFAEEGKRLELFLQVRRDLRSQINRLHKATATQPQAETLPSTLRENGLVQREEGTTAELANPFDLVTANDLEYTEIPRIFVREYTDFNRIIKHFDTILEGQRGTGKTMILRYLAYETQIAIWVEKQENTGASFVKRKEHFVGIYCRLEQGVFDRNDLDAVENASRRDHLFEHRLSLFCLSHVLKTLKTLLSFNPISFPAFQNLKFRLAQLLEEPQLRDGNEWIDVYNLAQEIIGLRVTQEDLHLGSLLPGSTPTSFNAWLTLAGQLTPFLEFIQESLEIMCPFFILLDDFDVLRPGQQQSVFRSAAARKINVVCFKYGIMTLGKKVILSGSDRTYREGHDYDSMSLDWTDRGLQTKYKDAVQLITDKRLSAKGWPQSLSFSSILDTWSRGKQLRDEVRRQMHVEWDKLPASKKPKTFENYFSKYGNARYFHHLASKKIHHRYSGYEAVIDISSGIYRQYLELCNRIVVKAFAASWKPDSQQVINSEIQDEAIREYSRDMMDSLSVTAGDTTALLAGDINVTSKHMVTFIQSLSQLFKKRLHSSIREPEIFCISIRDELDFNPTAKAILDVAVRESILQRRSADYSPKTPGGPSLPTFMLNRRLAPRWGLGVRMQGRIEISTADVVLAAENTDRFVRQFSKDKEPEKKGLF